MQLTLTPGEKRLLLRHLLRQIDHLDNELVHTEKRDLRRELFEERNALRALTVRIGGAVEEPVEEKVPTTDIV